MSISPYNVAVGCGVSLGDGISLVAAMVEVTITLASSALTVVGIVASERFVQLATETANKKSVQLASLTIPALHLLALGEICW